MKTAPHRNLAHTRSIRRAKRLLNPAGQSSPSGAAIQVFLSRLETFLGVELFSAERPLVIGRHREAHLQLEADTISRHHCRISMQQGALVIEDLGSANGTLVNRKRVQAPTPIRPADAIQIGAYTLKFRLMLPSAPRSRQVGDISDMTTRVEAILSVDGSQGTTDAGLEVSERIDWRLYEDALLRATGRARPMTPKNVIPLGLVKTERDDSSARIEDEERTTESEAPEPTDIELQPIEATTDEEDLEERQATSRYTRVDDDDAHEPLERTRRFIDLDAKAEARLPELERMVSILEVIEDIADTDIDRESLLHTPQDVEVSSHDLDWCDEVIELTPDAGTPEFAAMGPGTFGRLLADELQRPLPRSDSGARALSSAFEVVPSERMAAELSLQTEGATESTGATEAGTDASSDASRPRRTPPPPPPATGRIERPRAHRDLGSTRQAGVMLRDVSRFEEPALPAAVIERQKARPVSQLEDSAKRRTPAVPGRSRIPARLVTPTAIRIQAPITDACATGPTDRRTDSRVPATPRRSESEARAHLIAEQKMDTGPRGSSGKSTHELSFIADYFDAIEVVARLGDRLLDITTLRKEGEQYVLGHKTPQGAVAPYRAHPGLRLIRINDERQVDLVFPVDVGGHLVRDGETVALSALTEGRKYSCLRLKAQDSVRVLLGAPPHQISYHIRFTRKPRSITEIEQRHSQVALRPVQLAAP